MTVIFRGRPQGSGSGRFRDEAQAMGDARGLGPARRIELAEDVPDVDADRVLADEQAVGNLAIGQPGGDEREVLELVAAGGGSIGSGVAGSPDARSRRARRLSDSISERSGPAS